MKSIAESMHNFDRENFQRVAAGLPEMQDEQAVKRRAAKTAEIFNELFRQLLAVFRCWPTNQWKTSTRCVASGCWRSKRTDHHG
nr:Replication protein P [Klebsiella pneumoniae]